MSIKEKGGVKVIPYRFAPPVKRFAPNNQRNYKLLLPKIKVNQKLDHSFEKNPNTSNVYKLARSFIYIPFTCFYQLSQFIGRLKKIKFYYNTFLSLSLNTF